MTKLINIQHVMLSLQPGGLENGVVNVINGLDETRFHSSVTCLQQSGAFAARIRSAGVGIHVMGLKPGNDFALPIRLARLFRNTRTDIVHTRNAEAFYYGLIGAKLAGVRAVIHSEHGRVLPDSRRRMRLQRWLLRFTDAAFAVSDQLRRDLAFHLRVPEDCFRVIYNGVNVNRNARADRAAARRVFGASDTDIVIGSVGRLVVVKNYQLLLRALGTILDSQARLVLIGDGPERAELESLAVKQGLNGRVCLLGHREDVADLLAGMDIFVLPSLSEGMSNTLLEAMAAGLAVIASDVGGNREIVEHERSGLLFTSGDSTGLRERLIELIENLPRRSELGHAAQTRVLAHFSMPTMIRSYEDLYERTARGEKNVAVG